MLLAVLTLSAQQILICIGVISVCLITLTVALCNVFVEGIRNRDRIFRIHKDIQTFRIILNAISDHIESSIQSDDDIVDDISSLSTAVDAINAKISDLESQLEL